MEKKRIIRYGAAFISLAVLFVIILVAKKYIPKFPMSVVLMVLGAMATAFLHIDRLGVKLLPHVDSGFPKLMVPDFTLLPVHLLLWHRHCLPLITMPTDMDIRLIITERCLLIL